MIAGDLLCDQEMKKLNYATMIFLTMPFVAFGICVGLFETCVGTDGAAAEFVVRPFLWAYRRKDRSNATTTISNDKA